MMPEATSKAWFRRRDILPPRMLSAPRSSQHRVKLRSTSTRGSQSYSEWWQIGAPRPMKMGNIVSPWRYDCACRSARLLPSQRRRRTRRAHGACKLNVEKGQLIAYAANGMIRSFKSKPLAELWEKGRASKIDAKMQVRILRRLDRLDAAAVPEEMNIPGFDFHALRGFKPTRYSVHVNGPWCITFEFEDRDACRVDFEQYH